MVYWWLSERRAADDLRLDCFNATSRLKNVLMPMWAFGLARTLGLTWGVVLDL